MWWFEAELFFSQSYWIWAVNITWVGLMGGASYVNGFYVIRSTDKLRTKYKELAAMTCSMFDDTGVLSAAIFSLILE